MSIPQQPSLIDQALIRTLPYPIYVVDRDLVVRQANLKAMELGKNLELGNVVPEEIRSLINEAILRKQDLGRDALHRPLSLANGQTCFPQIFRLEGIFNGQDGWAVLLMDETPWDENREAKAKALRTLSHEVKTPLTSIRLSLHLLLEEKLGTLNADQRELLEMSRDECEHMLATMQSQLHLMGQQIGSKTVDRTNGAR